MSLQNLQTNLLVSLTVVFTAHTLSLGRAICPHGYIERGRWDNNIYQTFCCKRVSCEPGKYVEKCSFDLGEDTCQSCSEDTYMFDETNSDFVSLCESFDSCTTGSKRVNYLPSSGCRKPCICDTELNNYGFDGCSCKQFNGSCSAGTKLTLNGTCLPTSIADIMNDLRPTKEAVDIPVRKKELIQNDSLSQIRHNGDLKTTTKAVYIPDRKKELTQNENKTENSIKETDTCTWENCGRWVLLAGVVLIIVAIGIAVCVFLTKKCQKSDRDNENYEMVQTQAMTGLLTDSGVSLTSRPSINGEPITEEPVLTTGKPIAAVAPYKNDDVVNQPEATPLMRTQMDRELVQNDSPAYQFPEISFRRPVDMDTEEQEDNQSELVNVQHDFGSGLSSISS